MSLKLVTSNGLTEKMKTAIVTGASRGIGRAISEKLAQNGYRVVGISRNIEAGDPFTIVFQADISDIDSHRGMIEEITQNFGRIDLLVNNAGVAPMERLDILETKAESYDRLMSINLRGPFFFTQLVTKEMIRNTPVEGYKPKVIFISSVSAVASSPERPEYCISKAGMSMASQLFADRLAGEGIAVFEVRPGVIHTDMTRGVEKKYDQKIAEGLVPQNRWGEPEDIARGVLTLAEGGIPYSTGTIIEMSGGMNIRHL